MRNSTKCNCSCSTKGDSRLFVHEESRNIWLRSVYSNRRNSSTLSLSKIEVNVSSELNCIRGFLSKFLSSVVLMAPTRWLKFGSKILFCYTYFVSNNCLISSILNDLSHLEIQWVIISFRHSPRYFR